MARTRNPKTTETIDLTARPSETPNEQPVEKFPYEGRLVVRPEFWDRVLDSIPPWGDEIVAIILIVFGIVSFLSLFDVSSDATISRAWSDALTSLFGFGSIVVAAGILGLGILILLPKIGVLIKFPAQRILAIEIAFLALLAILHLTTGDSEWRAIARAGYGGGIIGWGLSTLIGSLFSSAFALFIYSLLFGTCIAYIAGIRFRHVVAVLKRTSTRTRGFGSSVAESLPEPKTEARAEAPAPPSQPVAPEISRLNIVRIRPDPENLPPSQRAAILGRTDAADDDGDVRNLTERNLGEDHHIVPEFNAIGVLKPRPKKSEVAARRTA